MVRKQSKLGCKINFLKSNYYLMMYSINYDKEKKSENLAILQVTFFHKFLVPSRLD
jgi:hypothetical protein